MVYKNIRVKMKGGKTRLQRVKVLKSGKYKFVKNLGSRLRRRRSRSRANPKKRRVKRTARRRRRRRSRSMTLPLAPIAGLAAGIAEPATMAMGGDLEGAARVLLHNYTGFDMGTGQFNPAHLMNGLAPLVAGILVHKFVGGPPLNVNKTLAASNVPFIRI